MTAHCTGEPQVGSPGVWRARRAARCDFSPTQIEALEGLLQSLAAEAAKKQGIEVKKTQTDAQAGRAAGALFRAEVTAKVFIMSAALALTRTSGDRRHFQRAALLARPGWRRDGDQSGGQLPAPAFATTGGACVSALLLALRSRWLALRDIDVTCAPALDVRARFRRRSCKRRGGSLRLLVAAFAALRASERKRQSGTRRSASLRTSLTSSCWRSRSSGCA